MNQPDDFKVEVVESDLKDCFEVSLIQECETYTLLMERSEIRYLIEKLDNAI